MNISENLDIQFNSAEYPKLIAIKSIFTSYIYFTMMFQNVPDEVFELFEVLKLRAANGPNFIFTI